MNISATIHIAESAGFERHCEPVRVGVPLSKGWLKDHHLLTLDNERGESVPLQSAPLCRWSDGSVKWVLLDFLADMKGNGSARYLLRNEDGVAPLTDLGTSLQESESQVIIKADNRQYSYGLSQADLFRVVPTEASTNGLQFSCELHLTTLDNRTVPFIVNQLAVEESGPVRTRLRLTGSFRLGKGKRLETVARIDHFAGSGLCRVEIEILNPAAALHPGGIWDLGDPGSVCFKDFSLVIRGIDTSAGFEWSANAGVERRRSEVHDWYLYQDSSGGAHWDSPNHVDADGKRTVSFSGYRVFPGTKPTGEPYESGDRATPWVRCSWGGGWLAAGVEQFWQNFPKALEIAGDELHIALFPRHCKAGFELQGGERKRHVVWLEFGADGGETALPGLLQPLDVSLDPEWVEQTGTIACFVPEGKDPETIYVEYVRNAIEGKNSFFAKREAIDEYGWRNFGDLYADHEAAFHAGPELYPSHYNNQYDFMYGSLIHFLRSGDQRWRELMHDLARHVADIDIYHTDEDRAAYCHGQFWHSYHYQPAGTGTHRGFTRVNIPEGHEPFYGGGPSNEQNYSSGLLHYYLLTGDPWAREAVLELARWVIAMDDGSQTLLGILDDGPTGLASQTGSTDYHHPGRGAGNCVNTLLDAYLLARNRRYFEKAEELIRRCIHPKDDLDSLKLDEPEIRWFYLVFLQILGKYLDAKVEMGEYDYTYFYARDSLLHYAQWVYDNEVPYKEVLHKVEYPTETWSAQDVRKACVMNLAAKYAPSIRIRQAYREKARLFFKRCLEDLLTFKTAYLARPMVLLAVYGTQQGYFDAYPDECVPYQVHVHDYGDPVEFRNQRRRVKDSFKSKLTVTMCEGKRLLIEKGFEKLPFLRSLVGRECRE